VQFLDEDRFKLLLPALVAQLGACPPQEALLALATEEDPSLVPTAGGTSDAAAARWEAQDNAYGRAAVATLVEMAVASGNDALWKPFNHQVP